MLYIKNVTEPVKNLDHLFSLFTSEYNKERFNDTFLDPECTMLDCSARNRSFGDILKVVKTYLPNTTDKEVARYLVSNNITCLFCPDIKKLVFVPDNFQGFVRLYGSENKKGYDISYNELLSLANEP